MQRVFGHFRSGEFAVLGVFCAVALCGLAVLAPFVFRSVPTMSGAPTAPSADAYRASTTEIMAPFLSQASVMTVEDFSRADATALGTLIGKTQERLLRERVPAEYRDAHLAFVLLLDLWKRAAAGNTDAQAEAIEKVRTTRDAHSWISGPELRP